MNFYQEIALSHTDDLISKVSLLSYKNIPTYLKDICKKITLSIDDKLLDIHDDKDLKNFRFYIEYLAEIIDIFSKTNPEISSSWAQPLIYECYQIAGLDPSSRKILIIHSIDSPSYAVYSDILKQSSFQLNYSIDVFVIPSEAKHDIASISLVAHETGHVFLDIHKNFLYKFIEDEFQAFAQRKNLNNLFDSAEINKNRGSLSAHIEEYICDYIGRYLLGPAFDFALLKLFCNSEFESQDITNTHPPVGNRINYSLESFLRVKHESININECLKTMALNFKKSARKDNEYIKLAEGIAFKFINERVKIEEQFNSEKIGKAWDMVIPELNAFRPPFETVSINEPQIISPSQALVCASLYFYGQHYKKESEFYKQSTLSEDVRYGVLRRRLIEHIRYSISNYNFIKRAKEKIAFKDYKNDLDSTIWSLREIKVAGKIQPHVVIVPTIDPKIQYSSNSVDLRLGSTFLVNSLSKYTHISPNGGKDENIPIESYYDEYYINVGDEFTLHPHQFVLAQTLEYVSIPPEFYALVLGRSTWGRLGLNIATATAVGSGFRGCITLELRNLGETPLKLKIGVRICQICLIPIPIKNSPAGYFVNSSKYIGPISPEVPKIRTDQDWMLLS